MHSPALSRYHSILEGSDKANFLLTKQVLTDERLDQASSRLWQVHDSARTRGPFACGNTTLLDIKSELADRMLEHCELCERRCGANRREGVKGHCGVLDSRVSSEFLHMGEEPDLVPSYTIFFSGCTFNCVYCQNWDISTKPESGIRMEPADLARMIEMRSSGDGRARRAETPANRARNVNWVGGDPTSNLPFILKVMRECRANLPQVWNSNMYLTEEAMRLLDGVIDVYLTDFKYGNDGCAQRLSGVESYTAIVQRNHLIAKQQCEVIVRHLVLPGHIECCTRPVLHWIAENLTGVKVNVMSQYRPEYKAAMFPELRRPMRILEYGKALGIAEDLGLDLCD
ncbi:MAG: radical SAM protein [Thermoplasmata archaeon]|jgi:putative pyruvate formate lyase activating enzyme|nr:radical SAM protein [Thermoplasmata archaeon]